MRTTHNFSSLLLCLMLVSCTLTTPTPTQSPISTVTSKPVQTITPIATLIPTLFTPNLNQPELTTQQNKIEGLVDIGGRKIFIQCIGSKSPTIILDFGENVWLDVLLDDFSGPNRVCGYKYFLQKSDSAFKPLTALSMMNDKHTILWNAQIPRPYVLVSFSIAAWIDLLYANEHPSEVGGMVLLMGWHPELLSRMSAIEPLEVTLETTRETTNMSSLDEWYIVYPSSVEMWDLAASSEQVKMVTSLGDIPLQVLTTDFKSPYESYPPKKVEAWNIMQQELADLSKNGKLVVVPNSNSVLLYGYKFAPEVLGAVKQIAETAQMSQP